MDLTAKRNFEPPTPAYQPDQLTLAADGTVQRHVTTVNWNGQDWPTIDISREPDGTFVGHISDPEHGGGTARGTFEQATAGLHPDIAARYRRLFDLCNPSAFDVGATGLGANVVIARN